MSDALLLSLVIVTTSLLVCAAVVLLFIGLAPGRPKHLAAPDLSEQDAVFVFRGEDLVDRSDRGRQLLASIIAASHDKRRELDHLLDFLEPRFVDLKLHLGQLVGSGSIELQAHDNSGLVLRATRKAGLTHLRLVDTRAEGSLVALDRLSFEAMRDELSTLRGVVGHVPVLAWRLDAEGRVTWANSAYIDAILSLDADGTGLTWPLQNLFGTQAPDEQNRLSLEMGDHVAWFSHSMVPDDDGRLHFATPIDLAVQTETSRREMMQVLTRIFASLPTGLALFDTERRLQVFNPALVDLMGLDPLFLAARPSLEQFLFTLRELRMLPEPKNFAAWRAEISEMEQAAQKGAFCEEWCVDTGRVFQVKGCPQPGGALAFFFEDVTSDATLARTLRGEIDLGQAVFDGLQDAVVVFNKAGDTLISNARYSHIWGEDPCNDLADSGLRHALALWSRSCAATPLWSELTKVVTATEGSKVVTGSVCLLDGTPLAVHAHWLRPDCFMIAFRPLAQDMPRDLAAALRHAKALSASDILHSDKTAAPSLASAAALQATIAAQALDQAPQNAPRKSRIVQHAGSRPRA